MKQILSFRDAKAAGLLRYFTGKPCAQGHISDRFISTRGCSICAANSAIKWKKENPEKQNAQRAEWIRNNPEKYRALKSAWSKAHPEFQAKRARKWFLENREKADAATKRWAQANRGKRNASQAKRRTGKLQRTPKWADIDLMSSIYEQARQMRESGHRVEVDHVIPLQGETASGLHVPENLQIIPMTINRSKSNQFLET